MSLTTATQASSMRTLDLGRALCLSPVLSPAFMEGN